MIKEWIRDFCGYDLLKSICDDIRKDIAELFGDVYKIDGNKKISKLHELRDTCNKADITNQNAIRFILHNMDIDKNIFQEYKYSEYKNVPWYIQELLLTKYNIQVNLHINDFNSHLYYKQQRIGCKEFSHIGELLDNIEKIDEESLNELSH